MNAQQNACLGAPQPFEIVIQALFFQEEMHHHRTVIQQHPAAFGHAFGAVGQLPVLFFDGFANRVSQGAELTVAVASAYDKKIRDDGIRAEVKEQDVRRLFIFDGANDKPCKF